MHKLSLYHSELIPACPQKLRFCIHHLLKLSQSIRSALGQLRGHAQDTFTGFIRMCAQDANLGSQNNLADSKQTWTEITFSRLERCRLGLFIPIHQLQTDTHVPNNSTYS